MSLGKDVPIKCFEIGSFFSIYLPEETTVGFENDETLAVFLLPDATQVFAGVYPAPLDAGSDFALVELKRFMEDNAGRAGLVSYAKATDSTTSTVIYQAVSELEQDKWMIARAFLRINSGNLLLLHWCGSGDTMKSVVLPALLSIDVNS